MPLILTTQTSPASEASVRLPPATVEVGNESAIGSVPFLTSVITTKWFVTVSYQDKVRFFEVSAACHVNHSPKLTVFGDVGDRINVTPTVTKDSNGLTLSVINNEASAVDVQSVQIYSNTV